MSFMRSGRKDVTTNDVRGRTIRGNHVMPMCLGRGGCLGGLITQRTLSPGDATQKRLVSPFVGDRSRSLGGLRSRITWSNHIPWASDCNRRKAELSYAVRTARNATAVHVDQIGSATNVVYRT